MTPLEISIGTRLELEILNSSGERVGNVFVSQLLEHQKDRTMVIYAPISGSRVVFIPDGATIRLTFVHQIQGLLGFTAVVISKEYRGKIAVMTVKPGTEIIKIQRRMHFRLDIILDAAIQPAVEADDAEDAEKSEPVKAYTKNISGSGICLVSEREFPKYAEIAIELELTDGKQIKAKGIIVRSQMIDVRKGKNYELGVRFTEISDKDQDILIRYIFEQQRLLLKKDKDK
jgi:c-di-GMP-binding flagellar brake protein YcgR